MKTKYRKKPVVIEAEQFLFAHQLPDGVYRDASSPTGFSIGTLEGKMQVTLHDWIITGVANEKYPCKDSIFRATYELVGDI